MEKRYSQLELFTEGRDQGPGGNGAERKPFIFQVNRYEKTIFILIGFVVTAGLFYCLGVEHGRTRATAKISAQFDLARGIPAKAQDQARIAVPASPVPAPGRSVPAPAVTGADAGRISLTRRDTADGNSTVREGFAIQIGSYHAKSAAERERARLAKTGLSSRVVKKGAYNVVLVGNFRDKNTARSLLSKLRQKYRDCYIRRL